MTTKKKTSSHKESNTKEKPKVALADTEKLQKVLDHKKELEKEVGELTEKNQELKQQYEDLHEKYQALHKEHEELSKQHQHLMAQFKENQEMQGQKDSLVQDVTNNLEHVSSSVNHLMSLFMDTQETFTHKRNEPLSPSAIFLQSIELQNDKDLLFGINIKQDFLRQSSANTIKYYLFACECRVKEEFEIVNLKIENKEQLALVGEAFAQYVRLTSLSEGVDLQGIIEVLNGTIIDPPLIKYYGDHSVKAYFENFVSVYSTKEADTPSQETPQQETQETKE